ncbi:MAG: long-chain fatty acid--CoA ligase, partial [Gemmataceae bacterium]
ALGESAETVVQNLKDVQPTHMSAVPRFYEKVLTAVHCDDAGELGKRLRKVFGPRIKWLTSGGAPLPPPTAEAYLRADLLVLQGYGLTETAPVISFNRRKSYKLDSVGQPISGVEVKIAEDGEILTRGPHVMKGYWKHPEWTDESIRDGWFHTGDLGRLDDDGFLFITGRKKELLVLSNGKKVVPPHIEGLLQADECIEQAVIAGEGKNYLTALIVPHWDNLRRVLQGEGINGDRPAEQMADCPQVLACLQRRIDRLLTDVSNAEHVRKFVLLARPFTLEAEELTVSLKLRRNVVLKKHQDELEQLYARD